MDPEFAFALITYGVVVPAAVSLGGLLLALRGGKRKAEGPLRWGDALAAGAGLLAGYTAVAWDANLVDVFLAPTSAWHWFPSLSMLAVAAGLAERFAPGSRLLRWGVRLAVVVLAVWLLARVEDVRPLWFAALGGVILVVWGLLDGLARDWPGMGLPVLLLLVALAAGAVLELAGSLSFAQLAGILAAVLGSCALAAWWRPSASPTRGAIPAVAVLVPSLLLEGYRTSYSEVPLACNLLVLAAPLALGLSPLLPLQGRPRMMVRAAVVLLPLGLAVTLAAVRAGD